MRRALLSLLLVHSLLWSAIAGAQSVPDSTDTPVPDFPYTPGLDVSAMDRSADPCNDFYQYSCGGWIKNNPIPADQSRWSVYGKLYQDNQRFLWGILDGLSKKNAGNTANQQKIGDYYAACMDETRIDQRSVQPLQALLGRIDAVKTKAELPALIAQLQMATGDGGFYFAMGAEQDFADSSQVIAYASGGGQSLPERDYYLKNDKRSVNLRAQYVAHVAQMLELLGENAALAKKHAAAILKIETALARASLSPVDKRDPYKLFHKMNLAKLQALTPGFDWKAYLAALQLNTDADVNVTEPAFFKALARHWKAASLDDIKVYLRWHAVHAQAASLSTPFVNADFAFFGNTLLGTPKLQPRWKRCVALVDAQLGEAMGQEFVDRAFGPELKARTLKMTEQIEQAMHDELTRLEWMSPATRVKAIEKLKAIVNKIGYPDQWRDYSSVVVARDDFYGNVERATQFEMRRRFNKIGKPLDRGEWGMTPPTVNAYFNAQMNDINFPAGILQPPLFDPKMDDAPNYGNTGGTIGHELIHAFDDEGRQFDAKGNLKNWWTDADGKQFKQRAQCVVDQYAKYTVVDNIKINSKLTLGEDLADLGGMVMAWTAWKVQTAGQTLENRDGLTPEQRFFVGFAQWACENNRPEALRVQAATDPHSSGKYRVNGVVVNLPEFGKAFACKPGSKMTSAKPCKVW
ncbi:MAG: M13 family metallopeptidase [Rhodoferax sp.]|nr:M13 family metallopeptidase [Rhodoferax sp.]